MLSKFPHIAIFFFWVGNIFWIVGGLIALKSAWDYYIWRNRPRPIGNRFQVVGNEIIKIETNEKIPWEEPLFLTRGRDRLAVRHLKNYRGLLVEDQATSYIIDLMDDSIKSFVNYAATHPTKQPGITQGKVWIPPKG